MNDKGNRYALAALKEKRATIAGEIELAKRKLAWLQQQLGHVDATLALFDPSLEPSTIPNRRPRTHINLFRQGELSRLVLGALRDAERPLTTAEIVAAILDKQGLGEEAQPVIRRRVTANLAYHKRQGNVVRGGDERKPVWALR